MTRPNRHHCNVITNRARLGHDEHQLARGLGVTRETMRGWAKRDANFNTALEEARVTSSEYWDRVDFEVREYDKRQEELAAAKAKHGHKPHRQRDRTSLEPPPPRVPNKLTRTQRRAIQERERQQLERHQRKQAEAEQREADKRLQAEMREYVERLSA